MFDLFDEDLFADAVHECFSVLDEQYVHDQCQELLPRIRSTFDGAYDTRFLIVDRETGKPMSVDAVLTSRQSAEEFLRIFGEDKFDIGLLLLDR